MGDVIYVIGGGIAGLGAAHFARLHGFTPVVLEAGETVGGRAGAVTIDGVPYETGGKNFGSDWQLFNGILRQFHSLRFDRQHPNFHIVIDGRLYGFDKKASLSNGLKMWRGIGLRGSMQFNSVLKSAKSLSDSLDYFTPQLAELEARYDAEPLTAHAPERLAWGPLRMFTVIMGAAEPDEFSYAMLLLLLSSFGKGSHHSLPETTAALFRFLEQSVEVRRRHRVQRLRLDDGRLTAVSVETPDGPLEIPAERAIVATPLHRLPGMVDLPPPARDAAKTIPYFPLALINADFERDVFTPDMNSIMFGPGSPLGHCSANRLYKPHSVRFTLSGRGARDLLHKDDESLVEIATDTFDRVHRLPGKPTLWHVQRHTDGLCAYGLNYSRQRRALLDSLDSLGGVALAGDYLFGHNMEGCLQSAMAAVRHLSGERGAYLRKYSYPDSRASGQATADTAAAAE